MDGETRKTILLLAYSISPIRGSEYSVGWNYVREMSKRHRLIVLYGLAGAHLGDIDEMKDAANQYELHNVTFVPVTPSSLAMALNLPNRLGLAPYSFYLAYQVWHWQAYRKAREIVRDTHIDLIHYLCPTGFREPGYLWKLNKPYIWGPITGVTPRPVHIILEHRIGDAILAALKNLISNTQFYFGRRLNRALKSSSLIVAGTSDTRSALRTVHGVDSLVLAENAIDAAPPYQSGLLYKDGDHLAIIWVGSIDRRKSLDILIDALAKVRSANWTLRVVGDGPRRLELKQMASDAGLDGQVEWLGKLPRSEVLKVFGTSHLHVITSMAEGNPTVLWEAMASGVPTVSLDHCGMHDVICDQCGVKIPISTRKNIVECLARTITRLIHDSDTLNSLSNGAQRCATKHSWAARAVEWDSCYDLALRSWKQTH